MNADAHAHTDAHAFNAAATGFVPKVVQPFLIEHIRAAKAKDARIAELEALCAAKNARIAELETDSDVINEALKAKHALLEQQLQDCITAHEGDATLDADKVLTQATFAVANVKPSVQTAWDKVRQHANRRGLVKPMYKNVKDLEDPRQGNGEHVVDRNDLKACLAKGMDIYTMDTRPPEGQENIAENRRRTYVPYAESANDQKVFEELYPKFTPQKKSPFKNVSRDPLADVRSRPHGRR